MGWGTAVVLAGMIACTRGVARSRAEPPVKQVVLAGLALAVLGTLAGVLMVMPTGDRACYSSRGSGWPE